MKWVLVVIALVTHDAGAGEAQEEYRYLFPDQKSCESVADNSRASVSSGAFIRFCVPAVKQNIPTYRRWEEVVQ